MYQDAIRLAQNFTLPVVVSIRREDGLNESIIGTFIVINDEGWILTAYHIIELIRNFAEEQKSYRSHRAKIAEINNDTGLNKAERRKKLRSLGNPHENPVTNFSSWWGRDGWTIESFEVNELADLAIGRIEEFDRKSVTNYPTFKNPQVNFSVGKNLCKLGFPFHKIAPNYDESRDVFELPPEALPIPLFPIEGIFTRTVIQQDNSSSAEFVETSSPGLRGQSGGPTFDENGRIWAIQSRTVHYPLGFSPDTPDGRNKEHQFLNVGIGTHSKTIIDFLSSFDVNFSVSED